MSDHFDDGRCGTSSVSVASRAVVAKRLDGRYLPGERGWVKTKNRETWWRYVLEREGMIGARR